MKGHPFPRGDDNEVAKIHGRNLKMFYPRTAGSVLTKYGTKHPWEKGTLFLFFFKEEPLQY